MNQQNIKYLFLTISIVLLLGVACVTYMLFRHESLLSQAQQDQPFGQSEIARGSEDIITKEEDASCPYSFDWELTSFARSLDVRPYNVTDILIAKDGSVLVGFADSEGKAQVARTKDGGETWVFSGPFPGATNIHALRQLSDGSFIVGVTGKSHDGIVWGSDDGISWSVISGKSLPNQQATSVWDMVELPDGNVLLATDSLENDPDQNNPSLYLLKGDTAEELASFPGIGVLSMAVNHEGDIVVATQESSEHDDPTLAGQAHIFVSRDGGNTWEEGQAPDGANRIYDLMFHSNGTLFAGTGIRGEFYRSKDQGMTWENMTHVPSSTKGAPQPGQTMEVEASRVYQILELCDGSLIVGTGNQVGDVFYTDDEGESWQSVKHIGQNIVVWGLAQETNGTLWMGTGSYGGDVYIARPSR